MTKQKLAVRLDENFPGHTQKKINCPSCNKKRFVQFYDFAKNEYLPAHFGRCDRQENCGYIRSPFDDKEFVPGSKAEFIPVPEIPIKYVDKSILEKTLSSYHRNTFVQFLIDRVGEAKAMEAVFRFYIGTAKNNGTIFWQVDQFLKVRTGQLMYYKTDGHRNKDLGPKKLFTVKDGHKPCLFGEHQIFTAPDNALYVIVESEKTSCLGFSYMNELKGRLLIWLASSGSEGLTYDKIQCLKNKDVLLCPDFSFHARATWGQVPMRKKRDEKGVLKINEHGEIIEGYESAKDRLLKVGVRSVGFFDPYPEVNDGSDIGDFLIMSKSEEKVVMPNFSKFRINGEVAKIIPHTEIEIEARKTLLTGKHNFSMEVLADGSYKILMNNVELQKKVKAIFEGNEQLRKLVSKFDLIGGSISPYK